jgi:hypothetical protein
LQAVAALLVASLHTTLAALTTVAGHAAHVLAAVT